MPKVNHLISEPQLPHQFDGDVNIVYFTKFLVNNKVFYKYI